VTALAEEHALPVENVLQPDALRRVAWTPPQPLDADGVRAALAARGARAWQLDLVSGPVAEAMAQARVPEPDAEPVPDAG
jgi:ribonuclease D